MDSDFEAIIDAQTTTHTDEAVKSEKVSHGYVVEILTPPRGFSSYRSPGPDEPLPSIERFDELSTDTVGGAQSSISNRQHYPELLYSSSPVDIDEAYESVFFNSISHQKQNANMRHSSTTERTAEESSKLLKASLKRKPEQNNLTPTHSISDGDNGYETDSPLVKKAKRVAQSNRQMQGQAAGQPLRAPAKVVTQRNLFPQATKSAAAQQSRNTWKASTSHPAVQLFEPRNILDRTKSSLGGVPLPGRTVNSVNIEQMIPGGSDYWAPELIIKPNPQQKHQETRDTASELLGIFGKRGHVRQPNPAPLRALPSRSTSNSGPKPKQQVTSKPPLSSQAEIEKLQAALTKKDAEIQRLKNEKERAVQAVRRENEQEVQKLKSQLQHQTDRVRKFVESFGPGGLNDWCW